MKLLRVVDANQLCDIVQAVHADELKHSAYKKVLDYVSASSRFRNRVNNVERTYSIYVRRTFIGPFTLRYTVL